MKPAVIAVAAVAAVTAMTSAFSTAHAVTYRWASSTRIIYVTGPGDTTLTQIKAALPSVPLELVDPSGKIWHLRANVRLEQGATLRLHGSAAGGDVNELRLQSYNSTAFGSYVYIRAQWGALDIRSTRIVSRDDAVGGPDTEHATYKRAFIQVRSFLNPDGVTPHESRMDIIDSEIAYLGFNGAESYGLSWKVNGSQPNLFDLVEVYGDVINSHIHHNYFGIYTFGAFGMRLIGNEVDHNVGYGLDPHDDSDQLLIEGNDVHHNGNHGIIASQRCDHLVIRGNSSHANSGNGIMLHRNSNDNLLEGNLSFMNTDSGIALFDAHRTIVRGNTLQQNKRGIRLSVGSSDNWIVANEMAFNSSYGVYSYKGSDAPTQGDGRPRGNRLEYNNIYENGGQGIKLADSDESVFEGNLFYANGSTIELKRARGSRLIGNDLPPSVTILTEGGDGVIGETFLMAQPSALVKINSSSSVVFEDLEGHIFDPEESGIATTVSPSGSSLRLTSALIGTTSLVLTRDFRVDVSALEALVTPLLWDTSGSFRKKWTVEAFSVTQSFAFTVGDLAPNTPYTISKDGAPFMSLTSGPGGTLVFQDTPATPVPVTYEITGAS